MTWSGTSRVPRLALALLILPCAAQAARADGSRCIDPAKPGPTFKTLRYDEIFCDRQATASDPWWFALKNMRFGPANVSVGGGARVRFEQTNPVRAGLHGGVDDSYVTAHALVHVDARFGEHWRAFGQIGYWDSDGRKGGPAPTDVDRGDVQQLFVEWRGGEAFARLGRQEAPYGNMRLMGLRQGPNIRQAFDGVRVGVPVAGGELEFLHLRPVDLDPGAWNNSENTGERVAGLYFTREPGEGHLGFDAYALRFEREFQRYQNAAGEEERNVVGGRLFGTLGRVTLTSELILQGGHVGDQSVRAWSLQNDASWKAASDSPWSLGLKVNAASGDSDPDDDRLETFEPMYAAAPYLMQSSLVAPANLGNLQPYVEWKPTPKLTLTGELQANWRLETSDGFYQAPLVVQRLDERGHYVGSQTGVSVRWAARKDLLIEAWASRLFTSGPLARAGGQDTTFLALQTTFAF